MQGHKTPIHHFDERDPRRSSTSGGEFTRSSSSAAWVMDRAETDAQSSTLELPPAAEEVVMWSFIDSSCLFASDHC